MPVIVKIVTLKVGGCQDVLSLVVGLVVGLNLDALSKHIH